MAIASLAGIAIAGGAALALVPQLVPHLSAPPSLAAHTVETPPARAVVAIDGAAPGPVVPQERKGSGNLVMALPQGAPAIADALAAQASCDDLVGSFLARRCQQVRKSGKSHLAHALPSRVAGAPLGHSEARRDADLPDSIGAQGAPTVSAADAVPTAASDDPAAVVVPPPRPAVADERKPLKLVQKPKRSRDVASAEAAAPAPQGGFDLFGPFRGPTRAGSGSWATQ